MQSALAPKLRSVIADHLAEASAAELAQVVGALAGNGCDRAPDYGYTWKKIEQSFSGARLGFQKLAADGSVVLDPQDGEHVAVGDRSTGLIWSRGALPGGRMNHDKATKARADLTLMGFTDWRLPTVKELLSIVDYSRHEPAIDTDFFQCESAYYWTSTPCAWNPADAAWVVGFNDGLAANDSRDFGYCVRAVRSGQ